MTFNSIAFIVFFGTVFVLYWAVPWRTQNYLLLAASYVFYAWWDLRFLSLIIFSTSLDFICGLMIQEGSISKKKRWAVSSTLVLSTFLFLVVQWDKFLARMPGRKIDWTKAFSWSAGWLILFAIIVLTLTFNSLHGRLSRLQAQTRRRAFLIASLGGNLLVLGIFKYLNFFLENVAAIAKALGLNPANLHVNIVLPIGISFYTFMTLSYTIDIYRGRLVPTGRFHEYALCVAFFPKLLAGPIERPKDFIPQITAERTLRADGLLLGLQQIVYGFFKKIVIADGVAKTVNSVFSGTYQLSWVDAMLGTLFFTIQIYCDFSGYSDIAIGTAKLLGFDLMRNFNFPYFSRNASEFWGRWHISLSSWFRDYVFFPLGGPYGKASRWVRNVLLTFLITGLWHGAAWTYVLWGLYHGVLLCLHRVRESIRPAIKRSRRHPIRLLAVCGFFVLTALGWILFRSHSLGQFMNILKTLCMPAGNFKLNAELPTRAVLLGFPLFVLMEFLGNNSHGKSVDKVLPMPAWTGAYAVMVFLIVLGLANVPTRFIYFVF